MLTAAAIWVVKHWKSTEIPVQDEWLFKLLCIFLMDKLTAINTYHIGHLNSLYMFMTQWVPLVPYVMRNVNSRALVLEVFSWFLLTREM